MMADGFFEYFTDAFNYGFWFSLLASFVWGFLSIILSPCHISSIPLVIGFLTSRKENGIRQSFIISSIFAVGILVTVLIIGIATALTGRMLGDVGKIGNVIVSIIIVIIGLHLMDLIKLPIPSLQINKPVSNGYLASFTLGLAFGLGLGPCTFAFMAPVIVMVFKISSTSLMYGMLLLLSFALGHCLLIAISGVSFVKVQNYLNWNQNTGTINIIKKVTGALVVAAGIYLFYNFVL